MVHKQDAATSLVLLEIQPLLPQQNQISPPIAEYCTATERMESLSYTTKWTDLEVGILSEMIQEQKDRMCMSSLLCGI